MTHVRAERALLTAAQHNVRVSSESDKVATKREGGERTLCILAGARQGSAATEETCMRQLLSASGGERGHLFSADDGLSGIQLCENCVEVLAFLPRCALLLPH